MSEPSTNGDHNGQDKSGKFLPGNRLGRGDPFAEKRAKFRATVVRVLERRLPAVAKKLIDLALAGEQWAMQDVMRYALGNEPEKPSPAVAVQINSTNNYTTLTPEQQARIDELAKVGLAKIATEDDEDATDDG